MDSKNLIRNEWIEDNSVLCATCKYATWGWYDDPWCKRRFVNGCIKSDKDRAIKGKFVVCVTSAVSSFDPYISCGVYEKLEVDK